LKQEEIIQKIRNKLIKNIQIKLKKKKEIAVAFSGSLDSSLITLLAKKCTKTKLLLYTIGFPDCYDFRISEKSSNNLGLKTKKIILKKEDLKNNLEEYLNLTKDNNKVSISFTLPFYILLKYIKQKNILTGHGADTLFGGFYKYLSSKNIKNDISNCFKEFISNLNKREFKIAKKIKKNLIMPLTDKNLSKFVLSLPSKYFIKNNQRKYILREVGKSLGLSNEIVNLPKKSFQYSTGIIKELKRNNYYNLL
jgi:asparagine synthase (glutamine-hydrolysing)